MTRKWEYKIVEGGKGLTGDAIRNASEGIINRLGLEGWDCYAINTSSMPTVFYLKRER